MFLFKRKGIYYVHFFDESENRQRRISTRSKKKPEARKFVSGLKEKSSAAKKKNYISLASFKSDYVKIISETHSQSYKRNIEYSFDKFILFLDESKPLSSVTIKDVESFIAETFPENKYGTALIYRTLKSAFNKAITWNYIEVNPFIKVKLPKIPQKNPAFLTEPELL